MIETKRTTISEFTDQEHKIYEKAQHYFTEASKLVTSKKETQKRVDGIKYVNKEVEDWTYTFADGVEVSYDYQYDDEPGCKGTDSMLIVTFPNGERFTHAKWMGNHYTFELLEQNHN